MWLSDRIPICMWFDWQSNESSKQTNDILAYSQIWSSSSCSAIELFIAFHTFYGKSIVFQNPDWPVSVDIHHRFQIFFNESFLWIAKHANLNEDNCLKMIEIDQSGKKSKFHLSINNKCIILIGNIFITAARVRWNEKQNIRTLHCIHLQQFIYCFSFFVNKMLGPISVFLSASLSFFLCVCACVRYAFGVMIYEHQTDAQPSTSFLLSISPLRFPISQPLGLQHACASAFRSSLVMSFNLNGFALVDDVNHSEKQTEPNWTEPKPIRFMHELSLIFFFFEKVTHIKFGFVHLTCNIILYEFFNFLFFFFWKKNLSVTVVNAIIIRNIIEWKKNKSHSFELSTVQFQKKLKIVISVRQEKKMNGNIPDEIDFNLWRGKNVDEFKINETNFFPIRISNVKE